MEIHRANEFYGHSDIIKQYLDFPKWRPLSVALQHGWEPEATVNKADLDSPLTELWVWSQRTKDQYDALGVKKDIRVVGAPFIYLPVKTIPGDEKQGTIVFPVHWTKNIDFIGDYEEYALALKELPQEYFPITVCLYYLDIEKGNARFFEKHGFKVISNGPPSKLNFLNNFITNVSPYKYATSNDIGTAAFYSINLDLKFFFYGPRFKIYNKSDRYEPLGSGEWYNNLCSNKLEQAWAYENPKKFENQKEISDAELGVDHKKTQKEMVDILTSTDATIKNCLKALSLPQMERIFFSLYSEASQHKKLKKFDLALEIFSYLLQLTEKDELNEVLEKYIAGSYFHRGEILFSLGEEEQGKILMKKCLEHNRSHKRAAGYLDKLNILTRSG